MTGFYVFLAIAGLICVIASFLLSEKLDGKKAFDASNIPDEVIAAIVEKNGYIVQKAFEGKMEAVKDQTVEDTKNILNHMANEKIMAVDEFSDTVIEKINQNHSEVIFLYNMLNEKEKELKDLVASVNQVSNRSVVSTEDRDKKTVKTKNSSQKNEAKEKQFSKRDTKQTGNRKDNGSNREEKLRLNESEKKKEAHTREEILTMYEEGMSVTDIAQQLKMGKGEVKLIIDLYQGAKG